MKNLENLPEEIFDWLAEKTFSELTEAQRQKVRAYLSEADYENYRSIVFDFQELDHQVTADSSASSPPTSTTSFLKRVLNYPIPLYQVAAAFLILAMATFAMNDFGEEKNLPKAEEKSGVGKSLAKDDYPEELVFNL
ncbi:MAG: hypothetical protein AAF573_08200 [Bacteroidota bacterium]